MGKITQSLILSTLLLSACVHTDTNNKVASDTNTEQVSLETQQIAALAFISYSGDQLDNTDAKVDQILQECVSNELARQPILNNRYALAWGPAAYRFDVAFLDDNMMYVAIDKQQPGHIVIAIRGTNPDALLDWFVEDFYVSKTEAWRYANPVNPNSRISKATDIGLTVLQNLIGKVHVLPPSNISLKEYLSRRSRNNGLTKITVTGHSLAGALAPALALWLKDTESSWNTSATTVAINVLPIAGATPGNADFARYYDSRLQSSTNRLHNPFDVVPQAWYLPTMRTLDSLYVNGRYNIKPTLLERGAFDIGIELAKGKDYTQITQSQRPLPGVINPNYEQSSYASQAGWQHHCGYYNALNMTRSIYKVNSFCVTKQYCNDHPTDSKCLALKEYLCNPVPITQ